jgi:hypothetical protein
MQKIITAVLLKILVFRDITPCRSAFIYTVIQSSLLMLLDTEDGSTKILRNVDEYAPMYIT